MGQQFARQEKNKIGDLPSINKKYKPVILLGSGPHGLLLKVKELKTKEIYVIKASDQIPSDPDEKSPLDREYEALQYLNRGNGHPNVIRVHQYFEYKYSPLNPLKKREDREKKERYQCLIIDYHAGTDLGHVLTDKKLPIDLTSMISNFITLLSTLQYMHNNHYVHVDLKPSNILIVPKTDNEDTIKICDFRYSQRLSRIGVADTNSGLNLFFAAPEVLEHQKLNEKVDIWNAGIILFQCLLHLPTKKLEDLLITILKVKYLKNVKARNQFVKSFEWTEEEKTKYVENIELMTNVPLKQHPAFLRRLLLYGHKNDIFPKDIFPRYLSDKEPAIVSLLERMVCLRDKRLTIEEVLNHPTMQTFEGVVGEDEIECEISSSVLCMFLKRGEKVQSTFEKLLQITDFKKFINRDKGIELLCGILQKSIHRTPQISQLSSATGSLSIIKDYLDGADGRYVIYLVMKSLVRIFLMENDVSILHEISSCFRMFKLRGMFLQFISENCDGVNYAIVLLLLLCVHCPTMCHVMIEGNSHVFENVSSQDYLEEDDEENEKETEEEEEETEGENEEKIGDSKSRIKSKSFLVKLLEAKGEENEPYIYSLMERICEFLEPNEIVNLVRTPDGEIHETLVFLKRYQGRVISKKLAKVIGERIKLDLEEEVEVRENLLLLLALMRYDKDNVPKALPSLRMGMARPDEMQVGGTGKGKRKTKSSAASSGQGQVPIDVRFNYFWIPCGVNVMIEGSGDRLKCVSSEKCRLEVITSQPILRKEKNKVEKAHEDNVKDEIVPDRDENIVDSQTEEMKDDVIGYYEIKITCGGIFDDFDFGVYFDTARGVEVKVFFNCSSGNLSVFKDKELMKTERVGSVEEEKRRKKLERMKKRKAQERVNEGGLSNSGIRNVFLAYTGTVLGFGILSNGNIIIFRNGKVFRCQTNIFEFYSDDDDFFGFDDVSPVIPQKQQDYDPKSLQKKAAQPSSLRVYSLIKIDGNEGFQCDVRYHLIDSLKKVSSSSSLISSLRNAVKKKKTKQQSNFLNLQFELPFPETWAVPGGGKDQLLETRRQASLINTNLLKEYVGAEAIREVLSRGGDQDVKFLCKKVLQKFDDPKKDTSDPLLRKMLDEDGIYSKKARWIFWKISGGVRIEKVEEFLEGTSQFFLPQNEGDVGLFSIPEDEGIERIKWWNVFSSSSRRD